MTKLGTIEISDSRFESNHLRFMTVKSPNLKGRGDICVFVPPDIRADEQLPVVILLHGVYGSAWAWTHSAGVHLQSIKMMEQGVISKMIIAMPSDGLWGDGSAYLPHHGSDFEKWIAEDIISALAQTISGASEASPLFIAGLSMGGFGALRIGAKYGKRFSGISGHSSITSVSQMKLFVEEDVSDYFQQDNTDEDVFETIMKYKHTLPPMRFDCGTTDQLIEYNRNLHRQLNENGIEHIYKEYPGSHAWSYWEKHIGESLQFFNGQINK